MSLQPYLFCCRCQCLRPASEVRFAFKTYRIDAAHESDGIPAYTCTDTALCSRLAGVGQGQLDADVGGPESAP